MSGQRSYFAAAFNARPFGMPIPPNWFGVAAFALLGAFVNPGLWLIGAGLEGLYLWALSRNSRFRAIVDAEGKGEDWQSRYNALAMHLDEDASRKQAFIEARAWEIIDVLSRRGATDLQKSDVRQMAWLHLKLLAARASVLQVIAAADMEKRSLEEQERRVIDRLSEPTLSEELKRSLEQQLAVLRSRREGHRDAQHRRELIDAEYALNEGGGGMEQNGRKISNNVQAAEKKFQSYTFRATNPGGHSRLGSQADENSAWNTDIDTLHPDAGILWWLTFVKELTDS